MITEEDCASATVDCATNNTVSPRQVNLSASTIAKFAFFNRNLLNLSSNEVVAERKLAWNGRANISKEEESLRAGWEGYRKRVSVHSTNLLSEEDAMAIYGAIRRKKDKDKEGKGDGWANAQAVDYCIGRPDEQGLGDDRAQLTAGTPRPAFFFLLTFPVNHEYIEGPPSHPRPLNSQSTKKKPIKDSTKVPDLYFLPGFLDNHNTRIKQPKGYGSAAITTSSLSTLPTSTGAVAVNPLVSLTIFSSTLTESTSILIDILPSDYFLRFQLSHTSDILVAVFKDFITFLYHSVVWFDVTPNSRSAAIKTNVKSEHEISRFIATFDIVETIKPQIVILHQSATRIWTGSYMLAPAWRKDEELEIRLSWSEFEDEEKGWRRVGGEERDEWVLKNWLDVSDDLEWGTLGIFTPNFLNTGLPLLLLSTVHPCGANFNKFDSHFIEKVMRSLYKTYDAATSLLPKFNIQIEKTLTRKQNNNKILSSSTTITSILSNPPVLAKNTSYNHFTNESLTPVNFKDNTALGKVTFPPFIDSYVFGLRNKPVYLLAVPTRAAECQAKKGIAFPDLPGLLQHFIISNKVDPTLPPKPVPLPNPDNNPPSHLRDAMAHQVTSNEFKYAKIERKILENEEISEEEAEEFEGVLFSEFWGKKFEALGFTEEEIRNGGGLFGAAAARRSQKMSLSIILTKSTLLGAITQSFQSYSTTTRNHFYFSHHQMNSHNINRSKIGANVSRDDKGMSKFYSKDEEGEEISFYVGSNGMCTKFNGCLEDVPCAQLYLNALPLIHQRFPTSFFEIGETFVNFFKKHERKDDAEMYAKGFSNILALHEVGNKKRKFRED